MIELNILVENHKKFHLDLIITNNLIASNTCSNYTKLFGKIYKYSRNYQIERITVTNFKSIKLSFWFPFDFKKDKKIILEVLKRAKKVVKYIDNSISNLNP
ncbi:MAG: hypothetical protein ACK5NU_06345 [Fusobacterium ulcerans]|uniref:hypothetical protein n=1 Tax=Fusobacterium ulcerans TaxID=861 RepID=UPI003A8B03FE